MNEEEGKKIKEEDGKGTCKQAIITEKVNDWSYYH